MVLSQATKKLSSIHIDPVDVKLKRPNHFILYLVSDNVCLRPLLAELFKEEEEIVFGQIFFHVASRFPE